MTLYRCVLDWDVNGEEAKNVLAINLDGDETNKLGQVAAELESLWDTFLKQYQPATVELQSFSFYNHELAPGAPPVVFIPAGSPLVGTSTEDLLPAQLAVLASHITDGGPPYRGRTYLTGFSEFINVGNSTVLDSTQTAISNFFTNFRTFMLNLSANSDYFAIIRADRGAFPQTHARVVGTTVRANFATQRRRSAYS